MIPVAIASKRLSDPSMLGAKLSTIGDDIDSSYIYSWHLLQEALDRTRLNRVPTSTADDEASSPLVSPKIMLLKLLVKFRMDALQKRSSFKSRGRRCIVSCYRTYPTL